MFIFIKKRLEDPALPPSPFFYIQLMSCMTAGQLETFLRHS